MSKAFRMLVVWLVALAVPLPGMSMAVTTPVLAAPAASTCDRSPAPTMGHAPSADATSPDPGAPPHARGQPLAGGSDGGGDAVPHPCGADFGCAGADGHGGPGCCGGGCAVGMPAAAAPVRAQPLSGVPRQPAAIAHRGVVLDGPDRPPRPSLA